MDYLEDVQCHDKNRGTSHVTTDCFEGQTDNFKIKIPRITKLNMLGWGYLKTHLRHITDRQEEQLKIIHYNFLSRNFLFPHYLCERKVVQDFQRYLNG